MAIKVRYYLNQYAHLIIGIMALILYCGNVVGDLPETGYIQRIGQNCIGDEKKNKEVEVFHAHFRFRIKQDAKLIHLWIGLI